MAEKEHSRASQSWSLGMPDSHVQKGGVGKDERAICRSGREREGGVVQRCQMGEAELGDDVKETAKCLWLLKVQL
jgi:hypothetical protein